MGQKCCTGEGDASQFQEQRDGSLVRSAEQEETAALPAMPAAVVAEPASKKPAKSADTTAASLPSPSLSEAPPQKPAPTLAPAAPEEQTRPGSGMEFKIILDRTEGTRLGIDVDSLDGIDLYIESISDGIVNAWNKDNPKCAVKVGDRIVAVDEVGPITDPMSVCDLVDACKRYGKVTVTLRAA